MKEHLRMDDGGCSRVKSTSMRIAPAAPPAPAEPVASNKSPELPSEASPDRTATWPLVPAVPASADATVTRPLEVPAPTPEDIDSEPPRPDTAPPPVKLTSPPWSFGRTPRDAPPEMLILPPILPAKKSHFCEMLVDQSEQIGSTSNFSLFFKVKKNNGALSFWAKACGLNGDSCLTRSCSHGHVPAGAICMRGRASHRDDRAALRHRA